MNRSEGISRLRDDAFVWDVIIIGGGATGLGCALDAVSRGYSTLLLEQADFGNGTSTRSTKLVHGGVRYLRQGNVSLVRESLHEREWMLRHIPHQIRAQAFLIPTYKWWERWYFRLGLWFYDRLAGRRGIQTTRLCNKKAALERVPTLKGEGLSGGVEYWDGQFDDARLCIETAQTVWDNGGVALNYIRVDKLNKENGRITGVNASDCLTDESWSLRARVVIQATGIFSDAFRIEESSEVKPMIRSSRGSHVVVDGDFLPNGTAVMVPETSDGRLLFLVPWLNKVIIGTTDVEDDNLCLEPKPSSEEVEFILETAAPFLNRPIQRSDIRSVFSGLRPLVMDPKKAGDTSAISREHVIEVGNTGLVTIAGGKWTTFRKMGEDTIDKAIEVGGLEKKPSNSLTIPFHAYQEKSENLDDRFAVYGSDAAQLVQWISDRPELVNPVHANLTFTWAEVLFAIRNELAESVEDVLARRTRALFLDAQAAIESAQAVAEFMATELERDEGWIKSSVESFLAIAESYRIQT